MKIRMTVCDICQERERPADTYTIRGGGLSGSADLCKEHATPLIELVGDRPPSSAPTTVTRRRRTPQVTTLEEIEAKKSKRNS